MTHRAGLLCAALDEVNQIDRALESKEKLVENINQFFQEPIKNFILKIIP